ncbi:MULTISPECIES: hypothetical protein [Oxalobacteraceae]|uniref:hypothetical protein n=1 Tax=Herminiimonas sp. Marseille-P9896 TaxID=2742211 RepID=UPI001C37B3E9|nr:MULTISPECIES: hypothetical protein [Oxalobacteraceae]
MQPLLSGLDTVECAYYLRPTAQCAIDFGQLAIDKEVLRQSKKREPQKIEIGGVEFFLRPNGTSSGYPFLIENEDMSVEFGEFNDPSFYVTYRSVALWHKGAAELHQQFVGWSERIGFIAAKPETLSRVDFTFDYCLPEINFKEDDFVSLSAKDSQHRKDRQVQTFSFGKGDVMLRVYNKIAEINEKSLKTWFFDLWGGITENVWRIEWQVRKEVLRRFGIRSFADLFDGQGDILRYLSHEHTTLRSPNEDSNRSRWPLNPLWQSLQAHIGTLQAQGVYREYDREEMLNARLMRIAIAIQGYLKRIAAVECVLHDKPMLTNKEAFKHLEGLLFNVHDPLTWKTDVRKRIDSIKLGQW